MLRRPNWIAAQYKTGWDNLWHPSIVSSEIAVGSELHGGAVGQDFGDAGGKLGGVVAHGDDDVGGFDRAVATVLD